MRSTSIKVLLHAGDYLIHRAPRNDGIHHAITRWSLLVAEVVVGVAKSSQIVGIVRQTNISSHEVAGNLACFRRVGLQQHCLFRCQRRPVAHGVASHLGVFRRHKVWVRAKTPLGTERQHAWAERSQHTPWCSRWCNGGVQAFVHLVEILDHCGVRLVITGLVQFGGHMFMTGPNAESEAFAKRFSERAPTCLHRDC